MEFTFFSHLWHYSLFPIFPLYSRGRGLHFPQMGWGTFICIAGYVFTGHFLLEGLFAIYLPFFQLLNSCNVLPGGCATCLKAIEKKGVRAMAVLYLLLKMTNPSGYRQLPSSKGKGQSYLAALRLFC